MYPRRGSVPGGVNKMTPGTTGDSRAGRIVDALYRAL